MKFVIFTLILSLTVSVSAQSLDPVAAACQPPTRCVVVPMARSASRPLR